MTRVITFGVYDLLHIGHVLLFQHIKELADDVYLIVAVQNDSTIKKYKPQAELVNNLQQRMYMVGSLRFVDEVVVYSDVDKDIQQYDFDIFAKGEDQKHSGFQSATAWCEQHGKQVVILPRTEGISSSMLRSSFLK